MAYNASPLYGQHQLAVNGRTGGTREDSFGQRLSERRAVKPTAPVCHRRDSQRLDRLKDYTLGAEALGRGDDFDRRTDPIARVEASRLRSRLELYYATEGASDPVIITLPKGSYVPVFENRIARTDTASLNVFWRRDRLIWTLVALIALFATVEGLRVWQGPSNVVSGPEMRLDIMTPPTTDPVSLAISPDGQTIVFVATSQGDLRFTSNPEAEIPPIWSPRGDSR